jgi:outer membrane receptor protein involved in Fe transport
MRANAIRALRHACIAGAALVALVCAPDRACAQGRTEGTAGESILFQSIPSVLGASRFEQLAPEAPSSVSVLTARDIQEQGWATLADIIRAVRGFFVTYDRNYSYVGARGFGRPGDYNGRVLLVLDGQRLNENVFDGGYVGTESLIDPALIDRIEIIRGPSSSLYGTNAFLAVINVVSLRGRDLNGGSMEATVGSMGERQVRLTAGHRSPNGFETSLSGSVYRSSGADLYFPELATAPNDDGIAHSLDADRRTHVLGKASLSGVTVEGAFVSRRKQIPTAAWGTTFADPRHETLDQQSFVSVSWSGLLDGRSDIDASAAIHRYDYEGTFPYDDGVTEDWAHGRWIDGELRLTRSIASTHRLVTGVSGQINLRQEQGAGDVGEPAAFSDDTHHNIYAVFAQDEWRPTRFLIVNAGLRYDHYSTFGGTTNPRLALLWGTTSGTMLKLLYGTAFRAPNNFELYYTDETSVKSNPALGPERTRTYEIVLERRMTSWLRAVATAYRYDIRDLISQSADPADGLLWFENLDAVRARGAEFELEASSSVVATRLSYAWQNVKDRATDEWLTNSPSHLVKLHVSAPLPAAAGTIATEILGMSERRVLAGGTTPGFAVVNLNVRSRPFLRGLRLEGGMSNAFDTFYADPGAEEHVQRVIPQDGRRYRMSLSYRF